MSAPKYAGARSILLINGPNLNLLGTREPEKYGSDTLETIEGRARAQCESMGIKFDAFQSNHEGALLDRIHAARLDGTEAVIINAGAYTHTSVALRDALLSIECPFIELHISNTHAREEFRHKSYLCDKASAVILGFGTYGYTAAIDHCARNLRKGGLEKMGAKPT
ncbi:catabolic 3-dehydroquinase [Tilletiopsis washingtonensis]|uniref:Catabolic 3-dehydroquinase n=1 Tax=Tilletiopsis washingtonensis TaxID=58919 RepID=A0A316Z477_9BASI|nr:catabolic 3-dehydroquinase [Tilletiopsis washingtonensis]PWN96550.1 catabolic 3-dehydroquinase [Tilletiopsis washingtonensis]